ADYHRAGDEREPARSAWASLSTQLRRTQVAAKASDPLDLDEQRLVRVECRSHQADAGTTPIWFASSGISICVVACPSTKTMPS
ncbi:hypothetical protein Q604_UNBC15795G0001, partial [human gut metagenome]